MGKLDIEKSIPFVQSYIEGGISETEFIDRLKALEPQLGWRFALDGDTLQFRNRTYKLIVTLDFVNGTYEQSDLSFLTDGRPDALAIQLEKKGKKIIGISGRAREKFNSDDNEYYSSILRRIFGAYNPEKTVILTGGYPGGIPLLALEIARDMGFEVIAVVPQVIFKTAIVEYLNRISVMIKVGTHWGDETPTFARLIDELFVFGGGFWTDFEQELTRQLGKDITIVPVRDRQGQQ